MGAGASSVAPAPTVVVNTASDKPVGPPKPANLDTHGKNCFWGFSAAPYLVKAGLKADELEKAVNKFGEALELRCGAGGVGGSPPRQAPGRSPERAPGRSRPWFSRRCGRV